MGLRESFDVFIKMTDNRASTLQICLENISKRPIARTSKICLDWHQKSDFM